MAAGRAVAAAAQAAGTRWDQVYAAKDGRLPQSPTALLVETVTGMRPGAAVDVGMGQGRNALYLAAQGWRVTGFDASAEAVRQVRETAARRGLRELTAEQANLAEFDFGQEKWDLIVIAYMHGLKSTDTRRMMAGMKRGGQLVMEAYHADVAGAGLQAINGIPNGYTFEGMAALFGELRVARYAEVEAKAEWSNGSKGTAPLVRLVAVKRER